MHGDTAILSICTTCRDGREADCGTRGGLRLARAVVARSSDRQTENLHLRGVRCMSQCKRPCVASFSAYGRFTYVFGDLDPDTPGHIDALLDLAARYIRAPEGFLLRNQRPEPLQASILGRLPPMGSASDLVTSLDSASAG